MTNEDSRLARFIYPGIVTDTEPTLKDIFDNLRNYPILAILSAATSLLPGNSSASWKVTSMFWGLLLVFLLLLTAFQSALVLVACFAHFFGCHQAFRTRWGRGIAYFLASVLFLLGAIGGFEIALALKAVGGKG